MKTFKIPVSWEEYGFVEIDANSIEEAIEIFDRQSDDIPLPEGNYVDGSWSREASDFIKEYNKNSRSRFRK